MLQFLPPAVPRLPPLHIWAGRRAWNLHIIRQQNQIQSPLQGSNDLALTARQLFHCMALCSELFGNYCR